MDSSDSYSVVEKKIQQRELSFIELEHLLHTLEAKEQITAKERMALLELARGMNIAFQTANSKISTSTV